MTDTASPLDAALAYAARGWAVFPLVTHPPFNTPATRHGLLDASHDPERIRRWWTDMPPAGIGVATGPASGIWALDIDVDPTEDKDGWLAVREIEGLYFSLPETMTANTPRGGTHLVWTWPDGADIRNDQSGKLGLNLDVRGDGGYIVVAPSRHRNGCTYEWDDGQPDEPQPAPEWLVDLVKWRPKVNTPREPVAHHGDRPGDLWAAQTTWDAILTADGWTHNGRGREGEDRWVRPGKTAREGSSATVGYGGSDVLKVFTSSLGHMGIDAEQTYTKLGYFAATRFGGDHSAAASHLAAEGFHSGLDDWMVVASEAPIVQQGALGNTDDDGGWPVATAEEIAAVFSGDYQPPLPEVLRRSDGNCMLYRHRVNSLAGEPGGGKTWIALHAGAEVLAEGGRVLLIDYEDRLDTAVRRLAALGADQASIVDRFTYISPTFAIKGGSVPTNVLERSVGADLVIIDSMGEALAHSELDQNVDKEVRSWIDRTARRMADGGAAVLVLDHVTKDGEHRGRWAIGSQRKLAAIDGIAYMMNTLTAATKETEGHAVIKCSKDRLGNYQHGTTVADVRLTPSGDDGMVITLTPPAGDGQEVMLTGYMEKISRFLESMGEGMSGRAICGSIEGKTDHLRTALRQLVENGNVVTESGPGGAVIHRLDVPFSEIDLLMTPSAPRAPSAPPPRPGARSNLSETSAPRAPTFKRGADALGDEASGVNSNLDDRAPLGAAQSRLDDTSAAEPVDNSPPDDDLDLSWLFGPPGATNPTPIASPQETP